MNDMNYLQWKKFQIVVVNKQDNLGSTRTAIP